MSALDLKLIQEFHKMPALYNRRNSRYKDKAYVERAWNTIARRVGYSVNNVKDRMYQLRNRYNLEKRKLQTLRDDGITNPKPLWPLYHNLNFLSSHIRQRKSYKMVRSLSNRGGFRGFTKAEGRYRIVRPYSMNRSVEIIKEEANDNDESYVNSNDETMDDSLAPMDVTLNTTDIETHGRTSQTLQHINILKQSLLADDGSDAATQKIKPVKNHHPSHKFEAFGSFLNSSLQDLPPHKALAMIDRFTSEIVQALIVYQMESSNS